MMLNTPEYKIVENSTLPQKIDHLLLCASFEGRSLSILEATSEIKIKNCAIFYCNQFKEFSEENKAILESNIENSFSIAFNNDQPTTIADGLIDFFEKPIEHYSNIDSNIVIDVSTFTRESLLITIKFLHINKDIFKNIYLYYRTADVSKTLSQGVKSIRSVLGYIGDINLSSPTHLILLSGFEFERAKEIIDTIEPDHISIGYGSKEGSISESLFEQNKEFTDELIAYYSGSNISTFCHSLVHIEKARDKIVEVISTKPNHNVVIAPLNNKLSTVAAGLAAIEKPECQIIYSQMESYNTESYSTAKPEYFVKKLEF
jgi:hypothetical protein